MTGNPTQTTRPLITGTRPPITGTPTPTTSTPITSTLTVHAHTPRNGADTTGRS
ncbi:conserved protein of unknown function [Streptomyces murinus]|uniref:hypothetical protein n=1 Tax=Streptomyces murinus TaxID=33900 RepID=UPI003D66E684